MKKKEVSKKASNKVEKKEKREVVSHKEMLKLMSQKFPEITKKLMREIINTYIHTIWSQSFAEDMDVRVGSFGTLKIRKYKERKHKCSFDGKTKTLPRRVKRRFCLSSSFKMYQEV